MEPKTKTRDDLKSYFITNAIPNESNFADLIEGMLNQQDDGVVKLPGEPLSIVAVDDEHSQRKVLNLYSKVGEKKPNWSVGLKNGFNLSDQNEKNRLYIDDKTGKVGIGTSSPESTLQVNGTFKVGKLWLETQQDNTQITVVDGKKNVGMMRYFGGESETLVIGEKQGRNTNDINVRVDGSIAISAQKLVFSSDPKNMNRVIYGHSGRETGRVGMNVGTGLDICVGESKDAKDFKSALNISGSGNVGIGTEGPKVTLHVNGAACIDGGGAEDVIAGMGSGSLTIGSKEHDYGGGEDQWIKNGTAGLMLVAKKQTEIAVHFPGEHGGVFSVMNCLLDEQGKRNFVVGRNMGWGRMERITLYGKVIISDEVIINGHLYCTKISETSDRRFKENIEGIGYGLDEVRKLVPISFNWFDRPNSGRHLGLIAQDVQTVIKEVVHNDETKSNLSISYTELIPVLIKAVTELDDKIERVVAKNHLGR